MSLLKVEDVKNIASHDNHLCIYLIDSWYQQIVQLGVITLEQWFSCLISIHLGIIWGVFIPVIFYSHHRPVGLDIVHFLSYPSDFDTQKRLRIIVRSSWLKPTEVAAKSKYRSDSFELLKNVKLSFISGLWRNCWVFISVWYILIVKHRHCFLHWKSSFKV